MLENGQKIVVGLSGGVDSSVTAYLLKQQGFDVSAVFMKNWDTDDDDQYCAAASDYADAQAVAAQLDIPLYQVNFAKQYWDKVFEYFLAEYRAGRTPNPDILCNKEIKFRAFLDYARDLGADKIATGHYAQIHMINGQATLLKGVDQTKDQSYFLYALNQEQLSHSLFPLGNIEKKEVRQIAATIGLVNHAKKDSTGICFIGERKFKQFLAEYLLDQPGNIVTPDGLTLGQHTGLMYYTLGQRQGLGIGGKAQADELPWYVVAKDLINNHLVVAQGHDHPLLFSRTLLCNQVNWINHAPTLPYTCRAKIRYRQMDQACRIVHQDGPTYRVEFDTPQRAATPGQSIVFYQDQQCLGGGIINEII